MTVQIIRGPLVDAPTPAPRRGGLLDVADVREGMAWMDGNDMFTSWNCVEAYRTEVCATDQTPAKVPQGPTVVDGVDFAVYLAGRCKPIGFDIASDVDRVFDLRESRAVEKEFETRVLGSGTLVTGTPVSVAHALAMMENALGDMYAGVGTIHISPLVATLLLGDALIEEVNGQFFTKLGTKVVVGTGYLSTAMYGTGDVVVYRSTKVNLEAPGTDTNTVNVLVERAYVVVADCVSLRIAAPAPQSASQQDPIPGDMWETGTDTIAGPGGSWTPPAGNLRSVTITVVSGAVEVDGDEVSAPHDVTFDSDTSSSLDPPVVTADDAGDLAVVSWVVST